MSNKNKSSDTYEKIESASLDELQALQLKQ